MIHHFILTRFCLDLWNKDKTARAIDKEKWIKRRLELFERYCLPSVIAQNNVDFEWILLVSPIKGIDNEWLKSKLLGYKVQCPLIRIVGVKPEAGWKFAYVFREAVRKRLAERGAKAGDICLTTYFDNDDALRSDYVEDIQKRAESTESDTFLYYDYGLQYFTELGISTRIYYPNNHFTTLVERVTHDATTHQVRTCYGYGSHFLIERNRLGKVRHITEKGKPMWVEVIHNGNVDNDVKMTFDTSLWLKDDSCYGCVLTQARHPRLIYLMRWVPQMIGQVIRRAKGKLYKE